MKKQTYIILTTVITLSTTCMEKERKKSEPLNIQSSLSIVRPANSNLYSINTLNGLLQPQPLLTTHVTRRQFSDVGFDYVPVYVPINTNEASSTHDIELTPLYKPVSSTEYFDYSTNTTKTSPQPSNTYLIERLHNAARDFLDYLDATNGLSKKLNSIKDFAQSKNYQKPDDATRNNKLITLIKIMNTAKHHGITEDFMGNFSYAKYEKLSNPYAVDAFTPFLFSYLKNYMLTIDHSGEKLALNTETLSSPHPAYDNLITNIIDIFAGNNYLIIPYLHSSKQILSKKHEQYTHITDIHTCFEILTDLFSPSRLMVDSLYNSLTLIEHIKKLKNIKTEKEFGYIILTLEKQQSLGQKIFKRPQSHYSIYDKNYIAMLCIYIEEYQQKRTYKTTPTPIQLIIWGFQKENIPLPDSFDIHLLDEKQYALQELSQLLENTKKLKKTNDSDMQELVDKHYIFNEQ